MLIQNLDSLKSWLTSKLEPICDADPAALAKYVAALVKKDKPEDDLRDVCIDQLEVFLGDKTVPFVDTLFEALRDTSYITPVSSAQLKILKETVAKIDEENPEKEVIKEVKEEAIDTKEGQINPEDNSIELEDFDDVEEKGVEETGTSQHPKLESVPTAVENSRKRRSAESSGSSSKEVAPSVGSRPLDKDHSRSKHARRDMREPIETVNDNVAKREPDVRSVSNEEKDGARDGRDGKFSIRTKISSSPRYSPSPERYKRRHRHREHRDYRGDQRGRRRVDDEKPHGRKRGRCKDYEEKGYCIFGESCPYDHGKDPVIVNDINFGMDLFMPPMVNPHLPGPPQLPPGFPRVMSNSSSLLPANAPLQPMGSSSNIALNSGVNLVSGQLRPVPSPLEVPPRLPFFAPRLPAPVEPSRPLLTEHTFAKDVSSGSEAYNPEQPLMKPEEKQKLPVWARLGLPKEESQPPKTDADATTRELITLTSTSRAPVAVSKGIGETKPLYVPSSSSAVQSTTYQRRPFQNQTTLEIRKIPREFNNIVKLSEYFQKFGKIVNVQVNYDNDPEAALVQFESNSEARRAYTCPEAVFGNRFIKTFWHRGNFGTAPNHKVNTSTFHSNSAVTYSQIPPTSTKSESLEGSQDYASPTHSVASIATKASFTSLNRTNAQSQGTTNKNDKKKEVLKKRLEIQKQRQSLLEKQIKEQKTLIEKLEKNKKISPADKDLLLKAVKTINVSVDKLRKDIAEEAKATQPKTKQMMEKELLDFEMDLFHKMQNGEDSNETRQRIDELRQEAKSLGIHLKSSNIPTIMQLRGFGRGTNLGRRRPSSGFNQSQALQSSALVDHRPRQLLVTGFDEADKDTVVNTFKELADVEKVEDRDGGRLVFVFQTRKQAEMAAAKASSLPGKSFNLAWYTGNLLAPNTSSVTSTSGSTTTSSAPPAKVRRSSSRISVSSGLSKEDEKDFLYDLDDKEEYLLLQELEEDEDEDEERSWRR